MRGGRGGVREDAPQGESAASAQDCAEKGHPRGSACACRRRDGPPARDSAAWRGARDARARVRPAVTITPHLAGVMACARPKHVLHHLWQAQGARQVQRSPRVVVLRQASKGAAEGARQACALSSFIWCGRLWQAGSAPCTRQGCGGRGGRGGMEAARSASSLPGASPPSHPGGHLDVAAGAAPNEELGYVSAEMANGQPQSRPPLRGGAPSARALTAEGRGASG